MKTILGINYFFSKNEENDGFMCGTAEGAIGVARDFKKRLEAAYDVEIHSWDCVNWTSPDVKAVLYLDCSWRSILRDPYLKKIPFEKRALVLIEPGNVNPALYFLRHFREKFHTIFTWDKRLLKKHPEYVPINVPVGAEPAHYRTNRFAHIPFSDKKLLFAASMNRWHYMPQSTHRIRRQAYAWFDKRQYGQFDLFGAKWNEPIVWYERVFGFPNYRSWKGTLPGGFQEKVDAMSHYKFALCFENNASQPGYISEKITDCFCARCVPIYYGSKGIENLIPTECYIDFRDFKDFQKLEDFIVNMDEKTHAVYVSAMNRFLNSQAAEFFSTEHLIRQIATGLELSPRNG